MTKQEFIEKLGSLWLSNKKMLDECDETICDFHRGACYGFSIAKNFAEQLYEPKECYLNPVEKLNPEHAFDSKDYYCSLCNYNIKITCYNFCPNCGAKIKRF